MINNILLISIAQHQITTNIGVDRIAAYLREKACQVDVLYLDQSDVTLAELNNISDKYDFYGFSVHSYNYKYCEIAAERLKKRSAAIIWYGGVIPSFFYKEIMEESKNVDYIVLGAGEEPVFELLCNLKRGDNNAILQMPAVVSKNSDMRAKKLHKPKTAFFGEIDDYYENYYSSGQKVYNVVTKSNVCIHNCSFCLSFKGTAFDYMPLDLLMENIMKRQQKYGVNHVFISDDNFLDGNAGDGRKRVIEICDEIIRLGLQITLSCNIRADSLSDTAEDRALLQKMSDAGFVYIFVGVESNLDEDLALYHKKVNSTTNQMSIQYLKSYNITPIFGFIAFNPYTDAKNIEYNYNFLVDNECVYLNAYARNSLLLEKYTPIYERIKRDNLLLREPTIEDKRVYFIKDTYSRKAEAFLYEHFVMDTEIGGLDPMQNLLIFYILRRKHNQQLSKFDTEIEQMKKEFLWAIHNYFGKLYIAGNEKEWAEEFPAFKKFLLEFDKRCKIFCDKIIKFEFIQKLAPTVEKTGS